jgi:Na+/H+ antiporter NhaD/arsenite permease-like protein
MIAMGLLSLRLTPRALREENRFTWAAIVEVAVLFAGIFITMIPALQLLRLHGGDLGLTEPWQYLWTAGLLSSFLDNAPTYLVFSTTANAYAATHGLEMGTGLSALAASPDFAVLLKAVSIGAVYMGANTYIGNAPNFMVKVIAETARERRVRMPSFFGYMAWSVGILIPVFVLMTLVAFVWLRSCL